MTCASDSQDEHHVISMNKTKAEVSNFLNEHLSKTKTRHRHSNSASSSQETLSPKKRDHEEKERKEDDRILEKTEKRESERHRVHSDEERKERREERERKEEVAFQSQHLSTPVELKVHVDLETEMEPEPIGMVLRRVFPSLICFVELPKPLVMSSTITNSLPHSPVSSFRSSSIEDRNLDPLVYLNIGGIKYVVDRQTLCSVRPHA